MRRLIIAWLYLLAAAHWLLGVAMTWFSHSSWFANYHATVLSRFYIELDNADAYALQLWWVSLFGATLQAFSLLLLALIYVADRRQYSNIWLVLAGVILVWLPQDIYVSQLHFMFLHVWIDLIAAFMLVVPLLWLWHSDRKLARIQSS